MSVEVLTPTLLPAGKGARRQAEMLAGMFLAGYQNPKTQQSYRDDLRYWFQFVNEDAKADPIMGLHRSHMEMWMRMLEGRGLAPATVSRRVTTVCMFYSWLVDEEILTRSPFRAVRRPKVPKDSTREALDRIEMHLFMQEAKREGGYPYALACLLAYNGLRISEALNLDLEHLSMESYIFTARIVRKGGNRSKIALPALTMHAIDAATGDRATGPLLLNRYGLRMTRENAARIVAKYARRIGCTKHITPHSLRHSAITLLNASGVSIRDVADFAGHEDVKTTMRYDRARNNLENHLSTNAVQLIAGRA